MEQKLSNGELFAQPEMARYFHSITRTESHLIEHKQDCNAKAEALKGYNKVNLMDV